ncbi:MAG: dipeptidase [Christensenellaceae bacterium]|nr:dipeptidase [Christensenellaceae bacterium]
MSTAIFPTADAHCDFLYGMTYYGYDISSRSGNQSIHLPYLSEGGVKLQFFATWIDMLLKQNPLSQCLNMIDSYCRMLDKNPVFKPFSKDFDPNGDSIATVLTIEGGEAIEGSVENLRMLYKLGVRAMTLTWNDVNALACPAMKRSKKGLTELGKAVVAEMNRIGMAIDLSHLNDAGIDDVLKLSTQPVFASHTNARALCDSPRCMTDAHIKAVAEQGGVIGVNFYYKQLNNKKYAEISDVIRHIEHIIKIGGIQCVALGSDFDGMNKYPEGLSDSRGFVRISDALSSLGLSEQEIYMVMYENLANYIVRFM